MNKDTQRAILRACARFLAKSLAPIVKRLDAVEKSAAELVRKGDVDDLRAALEKRVDEAKREPGPKGEPGRDADPIDLKDVVAELVACEELRPVLALLVAEAIAKHLGDNPIPMPKDGRDGADGAPGAKGEPGEKGSPGDAGKDGVGMAGAVIDRDGSLVVTLTNGEQKALGPVIGRDGVDGKDGLSAEDFAGEYVPDRGFVLRASRGEKVVEFVLPYMVHRGFWADGKPVKAGESTTHDGALWIAKRDTIAKPCLENADDWILAARKGRDGKDGRNGIDKTAPVKVDSNA